MEIDHFFQKSKFDILRDQKITEGWHFMGMEGLTEIKFSKEAKFEDVTFQTEESIREKYLQIARQEDPSGEFEVDLLLDENTDRLQRFRKTSTDEEYRDILTRLNDRDKSYFVFVRKKE